MVNQLKREMTHSHKEHQSAHRLQPDSRWNRRNGQVAGGLWSVRPRIQQHKLIQKHSIFRNADKNNSG